MKLEDLNKDETETPDRESFDETDPSFVAGGKKSNAGAMGALGLVMVIGAGVYFFYLKKGPATAAASDQSATASATISEFLHGNGGNAKLMEQTLRNTQK